MTFQADCYTILDNEILPVLHMGDNPEHGHLVCDRDGEKVWVDPANLWWTAVIAELALKSRIVRHASQTR